MIIQDMSVQEIVDFLQEKCVTIQNFDSLDFAIMCSPSSIYLRERDSRPFEVSKEFLKGIVFCNYKFFLHEVEEIQKEF